MVAEEFFAENIDWNAPTDGIAGTDTAGRLFGESLDNLLDLASWTPGADLANTYARMEREVQLAVSRERRIADTIRGELFPRIAASARAGPESGVYRTTSAQISDAHNRLLLNGNLEACSGISVRHETMALTFIQVGVCLVSYNGDQQTWSQRMFRRDYRPDDGDRIEEMLAALDNRRSIREGGAAADSMSHLAQRGILAYAERTFLTEESHARWRMCEGTPAPFELISGAGLLSSSDSGTTYPLMESGIGTLRELVLGHRRFVFVPKKTIQDKSLITIGYAMHPLEYAIIDTISDQIERVERTGHYNDRQRAVLARFREEIGGVVVRGMFRASAMGPPQIFYAHRDHVHGAALVAMADSVLQEQRSYPVLLDLAKTVCETTFGVDSFAPQLRVAYTDAGVPWSMVD